MGTQFNDLMARDSFSHLLLLHGETITYRPRTGGSYTRLAIVDRNPPEIYDAGGEVVAPKAMVRLHSDADTGIAVAAINTGGDRIDIEIRAGADPKTLSVFQVVATDGVIRLAVR